MDSDSDIGISSWIILNEATWFFNGANYLFFNFLKIVRSLGEGGLHFIRQSVKMSFFLKESTSFMRGKSPGQSCAEYRPAKSFSMGLASPPKGAPSESRNPGSQPYSFRKNQKNFRKCRGQAATIPGGPLLEARRKFTGALSAPKRIRPLTPKFKIHRTAAPLGHGFRQPG